MMGPIFLGILLLPLMFAGRGTRLGALAGAPPANGPGRLSPDPAPVSAKSQASTSVAAETGPQATVTGPAAAAEPFASASIADRGNGGRPATPVPSRGGTDDDSGPAGGRPRTG
jgi:hypothetical protein